jgi:hypothetical protein
MIAGIPAADSSLPVWHWLIVAVVAFIARFWVMASTCLVIENDGNKIN